MRLLWLTMLLWQDRDHVVRMDEFALSEAAVLTMEQVKEGLGVLSGPDKWKPGQEDDGVRIKRVKDGWMILKGREYQDLMMEANKKHGAAERQRAYREAHKGDGGKLRKKRRGQALHDMEMPRTAAECERALMRKEVEDRKEEVQWDRNVEGEGVGKGGATE